MSEERGMGHFRVLNHTADIGLMVFGEDLKALFENAGHAFFHLITDLRKVRCRIDRRVEIRSVGLERLMVDWLSELLYLHDVEGLLFRKFLVESAGKGGLKASVTGEPFQEGKHLIKTEVKAVTYHQIQVKKGGREWVARVILDL